MKNKILIILFLLPFFSCKNRQVNIEKTKSEEVKVVHKIDTIFQEKIVEKRMIVHDTIEKKVYDFGITGKPTIDPITGKSIPFSWDYSVFQGKDSVRYKGTMNGEGAITSKVDWEKRYNNLLEKYNAKETEKKKSDINLVDTKKFEDAKKDVQSEGYSLELLIYWFAGVAAIFYLLGLFSPKIVGIVRKFISSKIPFL